MPPEFSRDNLLLPAGFPRCRDRDDDHFLALAYHVKADALVTRDKQILALARRAAKFGVQVLDIRRLHELLDEH
jgi:predicted nucleic acid-binding protein